MLKRIFLFILFSSAAFTISAQEKISKSFNGIKEIKLSTGSGDCQVVKGSGSGVSVDLSYTYDEDNYIPVLEQDGDVLILKDKFRNDRSGSGSSKWKLTVPDDIELSFNAGSGDLEIRGLSIDLSSNTGSGDIEINDISGEFKSNSGSGDVSIDGYSGELKINTGSGDVELTNSKGELKVNLGSGDIDAESVEGSVKFNAGSGDITVQSAIITASSAVNSGSGDTEVILKSALQANISINSGSGDATLDFNGLEVVGDFTMKANKKHGEISAPFEFDEVTEEKQGNQTIVTKKAKVGNGKYEIKIATGSGRASVQK